MMHEPPQADFDDHARPNRFEIDLGAIAQFTRNIRALVGDDVTIFAALKCNAYGFGLVPVARTILAAGGNALSLVDRANAIELRRAGIMAPILVYPGSVATPEAVRAVEAFDLIPNLIDLPSAALYSRLATRTLRVAVKVDIGQERLRFPAQMAAPPIAPVPRPPHPPPPTRQSH